MLRKPDSYPEVVFCAAMQLPMIVFVLFFQSGLVGVGVGVRGAVFVPVLMVVLGVVVDMFFMSMRVRGVSVPMLVAVNAVVVMLGHLVSSCR